MESGAGLLSEQEPHCQASYNAYNEQEPSFDYEEPSLEESPLCSSVWVDDIDGELEEEEMFLSATGGDIHTINVEEADVKEDPEDEVKIENEKINVMKVLDSVKKGICERKERVIRKGD